MSSHRPSVTVRVCVCAEEGVSVCLGGRLGREAQVCGSVSVFHAKHDVIREQRENLTGRMRRSPLITVK